MPYCATARRHRLVAACAHVGDDLRYRAFDGVVGFCFEGQQRIERLSQQPDFAETHGRVRTVFGLEPADPSRPHAGYRSLTVVTYDPGVDLQKVDVSLWDARLADPEWKLVATALARGSSLQEVASFSPAVARTLAANAMVAVILSLLGMLVYIWVRFGSLRYSISRRQSAASTHQRSESCQPTRRCAPL